MYLLFATLPLQKQEYRCNLFPLASQLLSNTCSIPPHSPTMLSSLQLFLSLPRLEGVEYLPLAHNQLTTLFD